jgi:F420-non-reducing hydrogenase iron-sulfur subunit
MTYSPNIRVVRIMCSGRLDPQLIMAAFRQGADGVLLGGCHPGDCHYSEGNYKALRRYNLFKALLPQFGIESERVRLEWISGAEGDRMAHVANEFTETIRKLGPLKLYKDAGTADLVRNAIEAV